MRRESRLQSFLHFTGVALKHHNVVGLEPAARLVQLCLGQWDQQDRSVGPFRLNLAAGVYHLSGARLGRPAFEDGRLDFWRMEGDPIDPPPHNARQ